MWQALKRIAKQRAHPLSRKYLARVNRLSFFAERRNRLRLLLVQKLIYYYFRVRNRVSVVNAKMLKKVAIWSEPVLVVANHALGPDVLIHQAVHAHYNHLLFSFISSGGFNTSKWPILPAVLHFAEQIPRYGPGQKSVDRMVDRLVYGDHVLLFPEGTYNQGLVMEGFTGVARVAHGYWKRTGKPLPILPTCSIGGLDAYNPFRRYTAHLARKSGKKVKLRGNGKIVIKVGKPFVLRFSEEPTREEFRQATHKVMERIARLWGQKRILPNRKRERISKWIKSVDGARIYKG